MPTIVCFPGFTGPCFPGSRRGASIAQAAKPRGAHSLRGLHMATLPIQKPFGQQVTQLTWGANSISAQVMATESDCCTRLQIHVLQAFKPWGRPDAPKTRGPCEHAKAARTKEDRSVLFCAEIRKETDLTLPFKLGAKFPLNVPAPMCMCLSSSGIPAHVATRESARIFLAWPIVPAHRCSFRFLHTNTRRQV